ncbi:hypothetical protein ACTXT7_006256 [Hymenolepis weldensis]
MLISWFSFAVRHATSIYLYIVTVFGPHLSAPTQTAFSSLSDFPAVPVGPCLIRIIHDFTRAYSEAFIVIE